MNKITNTNDNKSNSVEQLVSVTIEKAKTGILSCDQYLWLIECLSEENNPSADYKILYDNFLSSRKDMPVDQLDLTCESLTDNILSNEDILVWSKCKLEITLPEWLSKTIFENTGTVQEELLQNQ